MLSVIILTKNEEENIADCIESIKDLADEIIVIDSHSTDRTVEIAEHLGAAVSQQDLEDFSQRRNLGLLKAKGDFIFYIDADERVTEDLKDEIKKVVTHYKEENGIDGYFVKRKAFYLGHDWGYFDKMQRLFYKQNLEEWKGKLHEVPRVKGKFGELHSFLLHYTHRDITKMVEKTNEWSEYEADLRFKAHHPKMTWWRFARVILTGFFQAYIKEKGYKNGTAGVVESIYQAFSMFITYAKLWEKQIKVEKDI